MPRMTFINLPVRHLPTAVAFYLGLGFAVRTEGDGAAACVSLTSQAKVMLLPRERFGDFVAGTVVDPCCGTSAIFSLATDSRSEVDTIVETALTLGGRHWLPTISSGPLYGRSFTDPDGHVWEALFCEEAAAPDVPARDDLPSCPPSPHQI